MKRRVVSLVVATMILAALIPAAQASNSDPGGVKGLITGCCFGLRVGADYNQSGTGSRDFVSWFLVGCCCGLRCQEDYTNGKDFHWRDWCPVIPYIGVIFRIWDGIDVMNGKTRSDVQKAYGSEYY